MPRSYLDSSAAIKLYLPEKGTDTVRTLIQQPTSQCFIAQLALVEVQRAFARRFRSREITEEEFDDLRRGFYQDVRQRQLLVFQLKGQHYRSAVRLVNKYAVQQRSNGTGIPLVRTLDAIHLAAALALSTREALDHFVSADEDLCKVAALEQLSVLNPEV